MIALDTSILARLILRDNPEEESMAAALLADNACFVGWSVLIELCWVLERSARLPRAQVMAGIALIAELETVDVPDHEALLWSLARFADGADFPDMVHVVTAAGVSEKFVTFDRRMPHQAGGAAPLPISVLKA